MKFGLVNNIGQRILNITLIIGMIGIARAYLKPGRTSFFLKILLSLLVGIFIIYRHLMGGDRPAKTLPESDDEEQAAID
jgi:Ca2+/Na+ antiporter